MDSVLSFVPIWAMILAAGIFLYVLLDGFDLGVGILYGFEPDLQSRNLVMNSIAPMSLLVPMFGMGASALWLGEPLQGWKLAAAALVMTGLCLNVLWPRFAAIRGARTPPAA